jgi:sulfate adenylyltransferase subunit 1
MKMLRFATAGSVDDGKSTLIGRLLFDSKSLFDDQLEALRQSSVKKGLDFVDLSLATDGLKAEREQGITIDVAYRYFTTPKRKFIIADTPGHVQYTRNMITGASTADAMIVLIDARKGVLEQSRRHAYIASLLRVPHLIICVNKMDLVEYNQNVFDGIRAEMDDFLNGLEFHTKRYIPVSALTGDNVVDSSARMPWYSGSTVLDELHSIEIISAEANRARLPVQVVVRPRPNELDDHRHYSGRLTGGTLKVGDEVAVLPSELRSTILRMSVGFEQRTQVDSGESVSIELADEIDVSRGDIIVSADALMEGSRDIFADICWLHNKPIQAGARLIFRHTTISVKCIVSAFHYRIDVNTGLKTEGDIQTLQMNDIAGASLRLAQFIYADKYKEDRTTGSFILIDEFTNETVAAGMIR